MAAALSHELRTPLNAIVGSISLLERKFPEGSHDRVHVDRLKRNSRHLVSMLDDVLDLLRAEAGQFAISPSLHRIHGVVDEALADVAWLASERSVTILNAVPVGTSSPLYWGDERRVRQIVVNLLTNAIKFTAPGGRVAISGGTLSTVEGVLANGDLTAYIRVEDTGRGIPQARIKSVFEPFQQAEPADEYRGHGLGLSISRHFARRMAGDITLSSEVGVGSAFTLWLPTAFQSCAESTGAAAHT
jgi:signal transduction histidine kinase